MLCGIVTEEGPEMVGSHIGAETKTKSDLNRKINTQDLCILHCFIQQNLCVKSIKF